MKCSDDDGVGVVEREREKKVEGVEGVEQVGESSGVEKDETTTRSVTTEPVEEECPTARD